MTIPDCRLALIVLMLAGCGPGNTTDAMPGDDAAGGQDFRDLNGNGTMDPYENESASLAVRVDDLLARMTLDEKVGLVAGVGWSPEGGPRSIDTVPGAAGYTYAIERLGIPSIVLADGPAGLRIQPTREGDEGTYYATAFPVETLLASTWNVDLVKSVGAAMGSETKEYGVDVLLAPGMNIHRNPLGGRNFEYYSEDPYLSGSMAAAMVDAVESEGVGATLKHFAANNQETNRYLIDTIVSERALREIYLRGFEIAVKQAEPWAVMSAYNQVNGAPASQKDALLGTLLRGEWDFEGVVMTDWFAGDDPAAQMRAGNELLMPGTDEQRVALRRALESGRLDEATLDRNVGRILGMVLRSPTFAGYRFSNRPDLERHAQVARAAAAEGTVLLENRDDTLPLPADVRQIAAFGTTSYDFLSGGTGSGDVNEAYTVSLVQALEAREFVVDADLERRYQAFILEEKAKLPEKQWFFELLPPIPEMTVPEDVLRDKAESSDIAIVTIGRNSGEFQDRKLEGDFYLTAAERALIDGVTQAFQAVGKRVVLILNVGNVVETASWREQVDAIVLPWQGGQEAGNALVDVLTGEVNPSGRLPTTFPMDYADVPSASSFPGEELSDEPVAITAILTAKRSRVHYEEGIYVGYRYFDSFGVEPAYEFGYGLSYTDFELGQAVLSGARFVDRMAVTVAVRNTGDKAGKTVVQVYLAAPAGGLEKPARELKGFAKTRRLAPGESQDLEVVLQAQDLASFDSDRSAWVADPGTYTVSIGASSRDIRSTATFQLGDEIVVEQTVAELAPRSELDELSADDKGEM